MGNFKVKFGIDSYYSDPEYRNIYVKVIGDAEVSFEGHDGSEKDQEFVKQLIGYAVMEALSGLSADQVSYKHIVAHKDRFISALKEQFAPKNITAVSAWDHAAGIREDGTAVIAGATYDLSSWEDLIGISSGFGFTVGVKKDGSVVAAGTNVYRQCEVSDWNLLVSERE